MHVCVGAFGCGVCGVRGVRGVGVVGVVCGMSGVVACVCACVRACVGGWCVRVCMCGCLHVCVCTPASVYSPQRGTLCEVVQGHILPLRHHQVVGCGKPKARHIHESKFILNQIEIDFLRASRRFRSQCKFSIHECGYGGVGVRVRVWVWWCVGVEVGEVEV
jgi:hypothetical protein